MNEFTIKRLVYSKYIYNLGFEQLRQMTAISDAVAILHFHDASELLLQVVADEVGITGRIFSFLEYWGSVKKATNGQKELQFKTGMANLNRLRVDFKHLGMLPNHEECLKVSAIVDSFFEDTTRRFFGIELVDISLAQLVENIRARECIKEAEKFIKNSKYKECSIELAKAFHFIITRRDVPSPYFRDILDLGMLGPSYRIPDLGNHRTNETMSVVVIDHRFFKVQEILNVLLMGVEPFKYEKFKLLTPNVSETRGGKIDINWPIDSFSDGVNQNKVNALFCLNFVIDTAMKLQARRFGLVDVRFPQKVKIVVDETKIYKVLKDKLEVIGSAKKGEIFGGAKLTKVSPHGEFWKIDWKGEPGHIHFDEANLLS